MNLFAQCLHVEVGELPPHVGVGIQDILKILNGASLGRIGVGRDTETSGRRLGLTTMVVGRRRVRLGLNETMHRGQRADAGEFVGGVRALMKLAVGQAATRLALQGHNSRSWVQVSGCRRVRGRRACLYEACGWIGCDSTCFPGSQCQVLGDEGAGLGIARPGRVLEESQGSQWSPEASRGLLEQSRGIQWSRNRV
jgi:hypothetical protein